MLRLSESNSDSLFFALIDTNGFWVIFKIPSSSIVRNIMCTYICSVIIQVIVTVMKKQPLKKGIRGERREVNFHFDEEKSFSPYFKLQE